MVSFMGTIFTWWVRLILMAWRGKVGVQAPSTTKITRGGVEGWGSFDEVEGRSRPLTLCISTLTMPTKPYIVGRWFKWLIWLGMRSRRFLGIRWTMLWKRILKYSQRFINMSKRVIKFKMSSSTITCTRFLRLWYLLLWSTWWW